MGFFDNLFGSSNPPRQQASRQRQRMEQNLGTSQQSPSQQQQQTDAQKKLAEMQAFMNKSKAGPTVNLKPVSTVPVQPQPTTTYSSPSSFSNYTPSFSSMDQSKGLYTIPGTDEEKLNMLRNFARDTFCWTGTENAPLEAFNKLFGNPEVQQLIERGYSQIDALLITYGIVKVPDGYIRVRAR